MISTNEYNTAMKKYLDSQSKYNKGEKGSLQHTMYGLGDVLPKWCNSLVALSIGSVRGNTSKAPIKKSVGVSDIGNNRENIKKLLDNVYFEIDSLDDQEEKFKAINNLIVFMFNLRHVPQRSEYGRGERLISYWVFMDLYKRYPDLMLLLLHELPNYGSYLDLTKIYELAFREEQSQLKNNLLNEIEKIFVVQLTLDESTLIKSNSSSFDNFSEKDLKNRPKISLCAKWFPKENGAVNKYTGITNNVCRLMYPEKWKKNKYMALKCLRKMVSSLNKTIETTEVYMSNNEFHKIKFQLVPGRCLNKFKKAWLDVDKNGKRKNPSNQYRSQAAKNYLEFLELAKSGKVSTKGRSLFLHEIVSKVLNDYHKLSSEDIDLLNLQFSDHSKEIKLKAKENNYDLGEAIPVVDVSGSMHGDPMCAAIGIGIVISENAHNSFKDYIITFDSNPMLIKLRYPSNIAEYEMNFDTHYTSTSPYKCLDWDPKRCGKELTPVEKILVLSNCPWGGSTNIQKTFNLLIDIAKKGSCDLLKKLYILTDMQWDKIHGENMFTTSYGEQPQRGKMTSIDGLKDLVSANNLSFPEIVCWNLRGNTRGYVTTADDKDVKMVSGFSLNMLKLFLYKGELESSSKSNSDADSWILLERCLYSEDYDRLRQLIYYSELGKKYRKKTDLLKKPEPAKTLQFNTESFVEKINLPVSFVDSVMGEYKSIVKPEPEPLTITPEKYAEKMKNWMEKNKVDQKNKVDHALESVESALYNNLLGGKTLADRMACSDIPRTSDQGKNYSQLDNRVNKLSGEVSDISSKLDSVLKNLDRLAGYSLGKK